MNFNKLSVYYDDYHNSHSTFINQLGEEYPIDSNINILDIGCGTGNETQNIYKYFQCKVFGIDLSEDMLKKARQKTDEITWLNGCAESIPLKNNSVDIITSFFSVHHFSNIDKAISEFNRIMKSDGLVFLVTISHEQMSNSLEYKFFPELLEYDTQRVPSIDFIERVFVQNGFLVKIKNLFYESRKIDANYLKMIESRYRTGLNFLTDQQIQEGISRIENAILKKTNLVDSIMCSVIICRKDHKTLS
ncbi:MAG: methyltransferase domain-containing protein [Candidatus Methylumidiphilus sp.]